jgi:hypothetical protein
MSGLPPFATVELTSPFGSFVPKTDAQGEPAQRLLPPQSGYFSSLSGVRMRVALFTT